MIKIFYKFIAKDIVLQMTLLQAWVYLSPKIILPTLTIVLPASMAIL